MIVKINSVPMGVIPKLDPAGAIEDWARERTQEIITGALEAIRDTLVDLSFSIALVGGGLCVLLWISGWKDGKRWAGILFMANILIRFLLGGGTI